jgi:hypothetical protein
MNILNVSIVFRIVLHVILEEPVLLVIMDFIGVQLVLEHQLNVIKYKINKLDGAGSGSCV